MILPGVGQVCLAWGKASSVPGDDAWLTPAEAAIVDRFRVSKRGTDWRLGRWVAKKAVASALDAAIPPQEIEILAGPGGGPRARVLAPGAWPAVCLSLSHSAGVGFAAAAGDDGMRIGCDVEEIAPRSEEFVSDYFTSEEAAWIRTGGPESGSPECGGPEPTPPVDRHVRANLLWSAKESVLKALGEGLRKDTRSVVVDISGSGAPAADGWRAFTASTATRQRIDGWWRVADGLVWTLTGWKSEGPA